MSTPQALNTALLRPCVLHILRAAGYHSTRPSVLDTLTGLAANYLTSLANATVAHAALNQDDPELALEPMIQDVRQAMDDYGCFLPSVPATAAARSEEEDAKGVEAFVTWVKGPENREIMRVALEGVDGAKDDFLSVLKKKHGVADEEESRYTGTVLGKPIESRAVKIEGADFTSLKEWQERLKQPTKESTPSTVSSRRQSSALSSLGDESMGSMEF